MMRVCFMKVRDSTDSALLPVPAKAPRALQEPAAEQRAGDLHVGSADAPATQVGRRCKARRHRGRQEVESQAGHAQSDLPRGHTQP